MASYLCKRGWCANEGGMLLLLLLLLLKYYPEEKVLECLLLKQKRKNALMNLNSDLKKKPQLKSKCCITLFEPVMPRP